MLLKVMSDSRLNNRLPSHNKIHGILGHEMLSRIDTGHFAGILYGINRQISGERTLPEISFNQLFFGLWGLGLVVASSQFRHGLCQHLVV